MRVSLIIAVYKDVEALSLIVRALHLQTYKNFELVVAEDGESPEMKKYIKSIQGLDVKHTTQKDLGIRKTRSLNQGIMASSGDYLVFIDGDCIPYTTFIESHVKLAQKNTVLSGRRVNLGPEFSKRIRSGLISAEYLEKHYFRNYIKVAKDALEKHAECGFRFDPDGWIYKNIIKKRKGTTSLLGCNYSCFKSDMIAINGYDESYGETAVGDDTDIEWRMEALGCTIESVKYVANVFHLFHSRSFREIIDHKEPFERTRERKSSGKYVCEKGLRELVI